MNADEEKWIDRHSRHIQRGLAAVVAFCACLAVALIATTSLYAAVACVLVGGALIVGWLHQRILHLEAEVESHKRQIRTLAAEVYAEKYGNR